METMTGETRRGVARLRHAVANQALTGSRQFELSMRSADELCRECEEELALLSWADVPAPVDADGETVPLTAGTLYMGDGLELRVLKISYRAKDGAWLAATDKAVMPLKLLRLKRPDSWGRLEKDVESLALGCGACEYFRSADACEGCAAQDDPGSCEAIAARDVVRRAKALAARDAQVAADGEEASRRG